MLVMNRVPAIYILTVQYPVKIGLKLPRMQRLP